LSIFFDFFMSPFSDIIRCKADPSSFGFDKFHLLSEAGVRSKIIESDDIVSAANHKNKKALVVLRDHSIEEGAVKLIAEKKSLCILFDLGRLIRSRGVSRAVAMSKMRNLLRLCVRFGALYSFASFSESESQIRTADELAHIAMLLGLNRGQARNAMELLERYLG